MKMLALANYEIISTQTKELACQTTGDGAMAEPIEIFWNTARALLKDEFWSHRRVIVTGGGTIEKLDDVRTISNASSGKMASSLAAALFCRGADVNLIASRFEPDLPKSIRIIDVQSSQEMGKHLTDSLHTAKKENLLQKEPYLFMAAAVSDYIPMYPQEGKLKKEMLGESWTIAMKQNIDLLSSMDKKGIKTVAFKAETDISTATANATKLLTSKGVDAVCLNIISTNNPFGSDTNQIDFITQNTIVKLPSTDKLTVAFEVLQQAQLLQKEVN
jgi:phosphopantothenoylcysteine decarboxylase/phosphopantothenate--cysteine ligase